MTTDADFPSELFFVCDRTIETIIATYSDRSAAEKYVADSGNTNLYILDPVKLNPEQWSNI